MQISDEALKQARKYGEDNNADIYLFNGPVGESAYGSFFQAIPKQGVKDTAILIIATYGGVANSAYRISRLFQSMYSKFHIVIPSACKSAGTLITIGAHKIIMSSFAELGPLDVQLYKADEIGERRSGLIARSALTSLNEQAFQLFEEIMIGIKNRSMGSVRFKMASELASQMSTGLLAPIYGQINPVSVGEDHRDLMVAYEYGERLAKISGNTKSDAVRKLVHDYPSHDFVIDFDEAGTLFETVEPPDSDLYKLFAVLGEAAFSPRSKSAIVKLLSAPTKAASKASVTKDGDQSEDTATQGKASKDGAGSSGDSVNGEPVANPQREHRPSDQGARSRNRGGSGRGDKSVQAPDAEHDTQVV